MSHEYDIITKKVLNENTGELEVKDFKEVKKLSTVKRGFFMLYKSYEEAVENCINSKLDYSILLEVKNSFSYARIECVISPTDISKKLNCSKRKVTSIIKKMTENKILMKVSKGVYRLNPYMVIPYRSNGEELQKEWTELVNRLNQ